MWFFSGVMISGTILKGCVETCVLFCKATHNVHWHISMVAAVGKLKHWERKSCEREVGFNFCFWLFGWTPALTSSYNVCFSFRTSTSWPNTCNTTSEKSQIHGQTCELEISHVRPNMRLRICASWGHALWPATTLLTFEKTVLFSLQSKQTGERVQQPQQKSPSVQNVREYKKLNLAADIWPFMHTIVNVHIFGIDSWTNYISIRTLCQNINK